MMTDPIADLLTRIRNGFSRDETKVDAPYSRMKEAIVQILVREGYLKDCKVLDTLPSKTLRIFLKYHMEEDPVVHSIRRESSPGCRVYLGVDSIPKVLDGMGVGVYSTPKGILTDQECRKQRVGGEYLCSVY